MENVLGHAFHQLVLAFTLLLAGERIFDIDSGRSAWGWQGAPGPLGCHSGAGDMSPGWGPAASSLSYAWGTYSSTCPLWFMTIFQRPPYICFLLPAASHHVPVARSLSSLGDAPRMSPGRWRRLLAVISCSPPRVRPLGRLGRWQDMGSLQA